MNLSKESDQLPPLLGMNSLKGPLRSMPATGWDPPAAPESSRSPEGGSKNAVPPPPALAPSDLNRVFGGGFPTSLGFKRPSGLNEPWCERAKERGRQIVKSRPCAAPGDRWPRTAFSSVAETDSVFQQFIQGGFQGDGRPVFAGLLFPSRLIQPIMFSQLPTQAPLPIFSRHCLVETSGPGQ